MKGGTPSFTAKFKNGNKLIICGNGNYDKEETFFESEFTVYNCLDNNLPISRYGAVKDCRIDFKNDTLKITELKRLAIGKNWELKTVDYKTESFYFVNDSLYKRERITIPKFEISQNKIDEFYSFWANPIFDTNITGEGFKKIYYERIKKLEILSIYCDIRALEILKNYGNSSEGFCCELAETKMDALKIIDNIEKLSTTPCI